MSLNNNIINVQIFWRAKNQGKKFPELSQTSFSGIVYCSWSTRTWYHPGTVQFQTGSLSQVNPFDT